MYLEREVCRTIRPSVICQSGLRVYGPILASTDLVPLALAVVVLEETLVERHAVLTEHEARAKQSVYFATVKPEHASPEHHQSQLDPEDRSRKFNGRTRVCVRGAWFSDSNRIHTQPCGS
jgi:hypothetical protein